MISSFASPSSSSSTSSSASVVVRVDKATSEFLIGPDWTLNIDICDTINSNHWLAKDVVKTLKKRLQHKNPKVQLLSLTLLETVVKNCGDNVHFQIAERNILQDMVKIVRKKSDMHVRDKILVLLDSWQEAFGGAGGKYPQYYWAYDELRRSGVQFPQRSHDTAPIFTPPATHVAPRQPQPGYGMPSNSSTRLDEAMAAEMESLSSSTITAMRDVLDLLADMLQAVNPGDREAVKDEIIVDLVDRCRANQKKLMQMLTTTGDENLLAQGLELNDSLQTVLAKHDAIASGTALPSSVTPIAQPATETHDSGQKTAEESSSAPDTKSSPPVAVTQNFLDEEEDEEDDFAQLARRHSKTQPQVNEGAAAAAVNTATSQGFFSDDMSGALVLRDPPPPVKTTSKEQDIIDLLSLTLSDVSPNAPQTPPTQTPPSESYPGQTFNSYVAPWAQPSQPQPQMQTYSQPQFHRQTPPQPQMQQQPPQMQQQHQPQSQSPLQNMPQSVGNPELQAYRQPHQLQYQPQPQPNGQFQYQSHLQSQPQLPPRTQPQPNGQFQYQSHLQPQPQPQAHVPQYSAYPPPPWAPTPGYFSNPNAAPRPTYMHSTVPATTATSIPTPVQQVNSYPARASNGPAMNNGGARVNVNSATNPPASMQKTFIPSYRLFEDLNVFGNEEERFKASNSSPGISGHK